MTKPWAEYKRNQRSRQRERKRAEPDAGRSYYSGTFSAFLGERSQDLLAWHADVMGGDWWRFEDDSGIQPGRDALIEEDLINASNSLGKAELLVGHFADMAQLLGSEINAYKHGAIEKRIAEIDRLDRQSKDAALEELERLKKMRHQLNKEQRIRIPQWKVTGG